MNQYNEKGTVLSTLNLSSNTPLYKQLKQLLRITISSGAENERIPSEAELSSKYKVSRVTVRKAVEELVEEGYLVKVQGRGTFTRKPKLGRDLQELLSFTRTCQMLGVTPGTKLIKVVLTKPSKLIRESLNLNAGEKIVLLQRLRYTDNIPVVLEKNHFPQNYSFLLNEDFQDASLYELLKKKYHIFPASAHKTIEIVSAEEEQAKFLDVPVGASILLVTDLVFDSIGTPIHLAYEYILGNKFKFLVSIPSTPG